MQSFTKGRSIMKIKVFPALFFVILLVLMFSSTFFGARVIGINIQSQWGASWKFPVLGIDNKGPDGEGIKDYRYLQSLQDGDVLVIGTHSNPQVFGSGTSLINWEDFWSHFRVDNHPQLGAVIICGCMEGVTDGDLDRIRNVFGAGAVFSPRGTYGLPHLISTETIITDLKNGKSLDVIFQEVRATHFLKTDPFVNLSWTLDEMNRNRAPSTVNDTGNDTGFDTGFATANGGVYIWINRFGNGGRIHIGSINSFNTPKKYRDEWLAGMSDEYLQKDMLFEGRVFNSQSDAGSFVCSQLTNRRYQKVLGWGNVELGDLNGVTYHIDGLGCAIP
jgi:hypothetical protein